MEDISTCASVKMVSKVPLASVLRETTQGSATSFGAFITVLNEKRRPVSDKRPVQKDQQPEVEEK